MSAEHDHETERTEHTMSRLQPTHNKGWPFAAESPWTLWHTGGSRQGHPRYTGARKGRPWVARNSFHDTTTDKRQHDKDKVLRQTCFQETSSVRPLESYMVADRMADESRWRRPRSSRRSRRETRPIIQEQINHVIKHTKRNEHTSRSRRINTLTKLLTCFQETSADRHLYTYTT